MNTKTIKKPTNTTIAINGKEVVFPREILGLLDAAIQLAQDKAAEQAKQSFSNDYNYNSRMKEMLLKSAQKLVREAK
jgi:hypothetical protein